MGKAQDLVGKTVTHTQLGLVNVLAVIENSKTKVEVECIQRAKGWDEASQKYRPVKKFVPNRDVNGVEIGNTFTQRTNTENNDEFGHQDVCHINELQELKEGAL